jgi:hypothetical protein
VERRQASVVAAAGLGPALDQDGDHIGMSSERGGQKSSFAGLVFRVRRDAVIEQLGHGLDIAMSRCVVYFRAQAGRLREQEAGQHEKKTGPHDPCLMAL